MRHRRHRLRLFALLILIVAVTLSLLAGCVSSPATTSSSQSGSEPAASTTSEEQLASNQLKISRADFGDKWPFTVEEGILTGTGSGGVGEVTFEADGVTYAVNGVAVGTHKYEDIEAIWAPDPAVSGLKKDIGPIIDRGLELCR